MNHLLANPYGIDKTINALQSLLYDDITGLWTTNIDGYGRVYKYQSNDGMVPQYYMGDGEFSSVLYNDRVDGHFFFVDGDKHVSKDELVFTADVKVVFMVNLPKIISGNEERKDAKAHHDVITTLQKYSQGTLTVTNLETGISNVLSGFNTDNSIFDDNHPKHVFSIGLTLDYYVEC